MQVSQISYIQMSQNENTQRLRGVHTLVELVENNLHPITEKLLRWQTIIGAYYIDYKLEKLRNSLAYKSEGYITTYIDVE